METQELVIEGLKVGCGIILVLVISYILGNIMTKREKKQDEIRRTKNRNNISRTRN